MFSFFKNESEEAKRNNQPFKIKEVVDASYKPEPDDTENVKRSLNKLGYYNPPQGEFTKFTETSMYDGIKNLQKEHKLTVDGRINPEGETMKKMNELLGNKEENIISRKAPYTTNMNNWLDENKRISKEKISDVNKHQYMSCLSTKGGTAMGITGALAGMAKEAVDIPSKIISTEQRRRYGGIGGIVNDSLKDLRNDGIGIRYGRDRPNSDCSSLLKKAR